MTFILKLLKTKHENPTIFGLYRTNNFNFLYHYSVLPHTENCTDF